MENKSHALIAGAFTLLLIALTSAIALWLGKDEISRTPYVIATQLKVSGLNVQAAVRYKGIKVGKVTDIAFDSKIPGQLILNLDIESNTPITQSTFATLGYQGVTGIAYIELDDDGSKPAAIISDKHLGARIPLRPGLFQVLETRGMAILGQTEELGRRLNSLLDEENRHSLTRTIAQIEKTAAAWETLPKQMEPAIKTLPAAIEQANSSFAAFQKFSDSAQATSTHLDQLISDLQSDNGSLSRISKSVEKIGDRLDQETLPSIELLTQDTRATMRSFQKTVELLNQQPQSVLWGPKLGTPGPGETGFKEK